MLAATDLTSAEALRAHGDSASVGAAGKTVRLTHNVCSVTGKASRGSHLRSSSHHLHAADRLSELSWHHLHHRLLLHLHRSTLHGWHLYRLHLLSLHGHGLNRLIGCFVFCLRLRFSHPTTATAASGTSFA